MDIKVSNFHFRNCVCTPVVRIALVHLVNMIKKKAVEKKSALLIRLLYYLKKSQKSNLSLESKNLKWGKMSL